MKRLIVLSALLSLTVSSLSPEFWTEFETSYFEVPRYLKWSINCFLDKGPCSQQNEDFKKYFTEDLKSYCLLCSPAQKYVLRKFFQNTKIYFPDLLDEFWAMYDPDSTWKNTYLDNIKNADISPLE